MTINPASEYLQSLLDELRKLPCETGWIEFKENTAKPEDIGEYLSALSNTAALQGQANGYVVWGVQDETREVVGTTFHPGKAKVGNEDLENWLTRLLNPKLSFHLQELNHDGKPVVILEISRAPGRPVQSQGVEFIRVGSYRQKLKDHPQLEQRLWRVFDTTPFEELLALRHVDSAEVLSLLDYPAFFELLEQPLPTDPDKILDRLAADRMIARDNAGKWDITNLGTILFSRNLDEFKSLARKAVRIIVYEGKGRIKTVREQVVRKGYAAGFKTVLDHLNALLPRNEVVDHGIRREVPLYPEPAIRELIPNALIHQDFSITGSGPMIEVFSDRLEITNPGEPLVNTERSSIVHPFLGMKCLRPSCAAWACAKNVVAVLTKLWRKQSVTNCQLHFSRVPTDSHGPSSLRIARCGKWIVLTAPAHVICMPVCAMWNVIQ